MKRDCADRSAFGNCTFDGEVIMLKQVTFFGTLVGFGFLLGAISGTIV
ncbi:hypothetical protein IQ272_32890 [Chroococcidiopsidales cyanobacterium LEGE 13417]|nr:hypothetical protein [Chroococcidiopsidales cyanobacterium LEGE 13417]